MFFQQQAVLRSKIADEVRKAFAWRLARSDSLLGFSFFLCYKEVGVSGAQLREGVTPP
ncbi:MAG: hypothetical protein HDT47_03135 [Ruminococcaceae bacterium]|nr:hypothetical protein [Oscillospiraceae bacterium]